MHRGQLACMNASSLQDSGQIASQTTSFWQYLNIQIRTGQNEGDDVQVALDILLLTNRNFLEGFWGLV